MNISDLKNLEKIDEISEKISHVPFDEMFSEKEIYTRTKIYTINQYSKIIVVLIILAFGMFGGKEAYNSYKMREIQARQTSEKIEMYASISDSQKNTTKRNHAAFSESILDKKVSISSYVSSSLEIEQKLKDKKISKVTMDDGSFRYITAENIGDLHNINKLFQKVTEQSEKKSGYYNALAVHFEIQGDLSSATDYYTSAITKAPGDPLIISNMVAFAKAIKRNKLDYPDK